MTTGIDLTKHPRLALVGLLAWHTALAAACLPAAVVVAAAAVPAVAGVVVYRWAKRRTRE